MDAHLFVCISSRCPCRKSESHASILTTIWCWIWKMHINISPYPFCPESRCLRKIGFMNLTSTTFKKYLKISLRVHSNLSHYRYSLHLHTTRMQSNKIFFLLLLVWANMRMSKKCESYTGRYWSMHQIFCCLIWNDERDSWFSIHINISIVLPSDHW